MKAYCAAVPGPKLANMLEFGSTPILPPSQLQDIGYTVAAYPLTLLSASALAMRSALDDLMHQRSVEDKLLHFNDIKDIVGFNSYNEYVEKFK